MEKLKQKFGEVTFYDINVDQNQDLTNDFNVKSIPCIVIVVDGRIKKQYVGVKSYNTLARDLSQY